MRRTRLATGVIILLCLMAMAVGELSGCAMLDNHEPSPYDDAGWIAAQGDTYSFRQVIITHTATTWNMSFKGFQGKRTFWRVEAASPSRVGLEIEIAEGLRGAFKVCLVAPDGTVSELAADVGTTRTTISLQTPGTYLFIALGNGASGKFSIRAADGSGHGGEAGIWELSTIR